MKHFLVFLLFFSIDVRVKASDEVLTPVGIFFEPKNCLETTEYCVIKNYSSPKYLLEVNNNKISMIQSATLVRHSSADFTLMKGQVLVAAEDVLKFNTPYGKIQVEAASKVLITKKNAEYRVTVLSGKVLLWPLGESSSVEVLAAYDNSLSAVKNLKAQVGIPTPAVISETLQDWAKLTPLSKKDFLSAVDAFKEEHANASSQLSLLSREIAMREIENNDLKLENERKAREQAKQRVRATHDQNMNRLLLRDE